MSSIKMIGMQIIKSSIMYLSPIAYPLFCIQATLVRTHYKDN